MNRDRRPVVLAITGASGAIYAVRLLQTLCLGEQEVHVTLSPSGAAVIKQELGLSLDPRVSSSSLDPSQSGWKSVVGYVAPWTTSERVKQVAQAATERMDERLRVHAYDDFMTPIASGSFRTEAMVVCPCSGSTLSGIAASASQNLVQRAAEVHLKEGRKLILVPRETPMSTGQLENLLRVARAGAVVLPAMPGWYHGVESIDSLVDFIVSRILDQLDFDNQLIERWKDDT